MTDISDEDDGLRCGLPAAAWAIIAALAATGVLALCCAVWLAL